MADDDIRALTRDMYAAYERRDFVRVAALLHDDIDWMIFGPVEIFPFAGPRKGKADVLKALDDIAQKYELKTYRPELMIVDGDRAAVMSDVNFLQRASGRTLRFRLANFLRFDDGRVIEFREFANTFDVVEQALGRDLRV